MVQQHFVSRFFTVIDERREQVPLYRKILMQECCSQYFRMGTGKIKEDTETDEENKQKIVNLEIHKVGTK